MPRLTRPATTTPPGTCPLRVNSPSFRIQFPPKSPATPSFLTTTPLAITKTLPSPQIRHPRNTLKCLHFASRNHEIP